MLIFRALCGVASIAMLASPALAQTPAAQEQKPSMEELLQRLDALQRRAAEGDRLISALQHANLRDLPRHSEEGARARWARPIRHRRDEGGRPGVSAPALPAAPWLAT
jgi:phage I-like protein